MRFFIRGKRKGASKGLKKHMEKFKGALEDSELMDLGIYGDVFTWRNHNHYAKNYIKERLDRAVATQAWRDQFPRVKVVNGDPRHSDHRLVIIDTHGACRRWRADDGGGN